MAEFVIKVADERGRMLQQVEHGYSVDQGRESFAAQSIFPKIYTTTLMAGEKSGNIDEVLTRYINFQRMAMTFRKKLFVSLIYPTMLVTVVTIMVMFLFTYVVPKFADLFNSLDAKLPAITLFMLTVGTYTQKYFPFMRLGWC